MRFGFSKRYVKNDNANVFAAIDKEYEKPSEIVDFRGLFLFFVYCGAGGVR